MRGCTVFAISTPSAISPASADTWAPWVAKWMGIRSRGGVKVSLPLAREATLPSWSTRSPRSSARTIATVSRNAVSGRWTPDAELPEALPAHPQAETGATPAQLVEGRDGRGGDGGGDACRGP